MTNKQIEIKLNKIIEDINSVLKGKQCEITGQYRFKPILIGFKPCMSQITVFECPVILKSDVCIDRYEKHQKTFVIKRTIGACEHMVATLMTHVSELETMLAQEEQE